MVPGWRMTASPRFVPSGSWGQPVRRRPGRPAPEPHDLRLDDLRGLRVAGAVPREIAEVHRLAPDDRARAVVERRPAEGVDGARDDGRALLQRDHQPAGVHLARVPEALTRALEVDADELALSDEIARRAKRCAVGLATPDREDADPPEELADRGNLQHLRLGQEVDRPRAEDRDQRVVDPGEVIRGNDGAALGRDAIQPVAGSTRHRENRRDREHPRDRPEPLRLFPPELRDAELGERLLDVH